MSTFNVTPSVLYMVSNLHLFNALLQDIFVLYMLNYFNFHKYMLQGLNYIDQLQGIDFIFLITGMLNCMRLNLEFCFVNNTRVPPDGNV